MIKILADQNVDGPILRGLKTRIPDLDIVRTEDVGLKRSHDREILTWAAAEGRLILTHDARTFINFAFERMSEGKSSCGVIVVPTTMPRGRAIEELEILIRCTSEEELHNSVIRLPL